MPRIVNKLLQYIRFFITRRGFDVRRLEQFCWIDQQALLQSEEVTCVIDVGANIGDIAQRYRGLFSDSRVICFEPMPDCLAHLRTRFQADPQITVEGVGVASAAGTASFHVNADADTSSLLAADLPNLSSAYQSGLKSAQKIQIELVSLDDYCAAHGITQIDVLKIDIQGGELAALRGAELLLRAGKIRLIYSEVFFLPFYQDQPLFGEIARFLGGLGYELHALYNTCYAGNTGRLQWADAIFVSPALQTHAAALRRAAMQKA